VYSGFCCSKDRGLVGNGTGTPHLCNCKQTFYCLRDVNGSVILAPIQSRKIYSRMVSIRSLYLQTDLIKSD